MMDRDMAPNPDEALLDEQTSGFDKDSDKPADEDNFDPELSDNPEDNPTEDPDEGLTAEEKLNGILLREDYTRKRMRDAELVKAAQLEAQRAREEMSRLAPAREWMELLQSNPDMAAEMQAVVQKYGPTLHAPGYRGVGSPAVPQEVMRMRHELNELKEQMFADSLVNAAMTIGKERGLPEQVVYAAVQRGVQKDVLSFGLNQSQVRERLELLFDAQEKQSAKQSATRGVVNSLKEKARASTPSGPAAPAAPSKDPTKMSPSEAMAEMMAIAKGLDRGRTR